MLHGFLFLSLSEGAALDLVAVLSSNELFVVGLVFAGHESFSEPNKRMIMINFNHLMGHLISPLRRVFTLTNNQSKSNCKYLPL